MVGIRKVLAWTLVLSLLLISSANAQNLLLSPREGSVYNLGDTIIITGQVTLDKNLEGAKASFEAYSKLLNQSIPITTKYYSFIKDTPVTFSQINKGTLIWMVPTDMNTSSDWTIVVRVKKDNIPYQTIRSSNFTVSKDLSVLFSVNKYLLNLGETLELSGTILDARGNTVEGIANIMLDERGIGTIVSDSAAIQNGYLEYSYTFKQTDPSGAFNLTVKLQDSDGNSGRAKIGDIIVSDILNMDCSVQEDYVQPGGLLVFTGNLRDIHDEPMGNVQVTALVTNPDETTTLKYDTESDVNGNFAFEISIPKLATPGEYTIKTEANDTYGNKGSCEKIFSVASKLDVTTTLDLNKTWYYPDEAMGLSMNLENNGNIDVTGTLDFQIDGKKVLGKEFSIEKGTSQTLNESWIVKGSTENHTINVAIVVGGEQIYETKPQNFEIVERPAPPPRFKFTAVHAVIILLLILISMILYLKRQDIKEYLWHYQLRRSIGKR